MIDGLFRASIIVAEDGQGMDDGIRRLKDLVAEADRNPHLSLNPQEITDADLRESLAGTWWCVCRVDRPGSDRVAV